MDIDTLLTREALITQRIQAKVKAVFKGAVRKHGLDQAKVREQIHSDLIPIAKSGVRDLLTLGMDFIKRR